MSSSTIVKSAIALALGGVLGTSVHSSQAVADTTVYNASSVCVWDPGVDLQPTFEGWIENHEPSGIEHRVSCGLILTNDIATTSTDDVHVYVYDNNAGSAMEDNFICDVYTCDVLGNNCDAEGSKSNTGTGHKTLSFYNLVKPAWGIPNVTCAIPHDVSGAESKIEGIYMLH